MSSTNSLNDLVGVHPNFSFALVDNVMMQAFVEAYEKGRDT